MNLNDLFKVVMELDLEPIKEKLMHAESGESWGPAKANAVEREYRRFLCLMKLYPNETISPLMDVDTFWHYHILDTMKYAKDCDQVFGYFLHHYPYIGMRGEESAQARLDSGERMRVLYETTFGERYGNLPGDAADLTATRTVPVPGKPGTRPIDLSAVAPGIRASVAHMAEKTAYCAGPVPTVAYCAGPVPTVAYCAGPVPTTAYCAGPVPTDANLASIKLKTGVHQGPGRAETSNLASTIVLSAYGTRGRVALVS